MPEQLLEKNLEEVQKPVTNVRGVPFVAGYDPRRNSTGKNKGARHLSTILQEALLEMGRSRDGTEKTYERLLVERILKSAIEKGEFKFAELIYDRLEGKAPQTITLESDITDHNLSVEEKDALLKLIEKPKP